MRVEAGDTLRFKNRTAWFLFADKNSVEYLEPGEPVVVTGVTQYGDIWLVVREDGREMTFREHHLAQAG